MNTLKIKSIKEKTEKTINRDRVYQNSFGAGSTKIGSLGVTTMNLPRLAYKHQLDEDAFFESLRKLVNDCARINHAKRKIVEKRIENGNLPLYSLGFIDLNKQYSTCGVNGLNEAVEIMGYDILDEKGQEFVIKCLDTINEENDKNQKQYGSPHNCEQIPGESASVKLAMKDQLLKYQTEGNTYELYSNQFIPLTTKADVLDRIKLQGMFDKKFSGGAICHINIDQQITDSNQLQDLIKVCAKKGVVYFAINYKIQQCENGHMRVGSGETCECGGQITNEYSRVVGYIVNTKSFNKVRREVDYPDRQFYHESDTKIEENKQISDVEELDFIDKIPSTLENLKQAV